MSEATLFRLAGWSAYLNAAMYIIILITLVLLFTLGGIWGPINDGASVIWALSFLPIALVTYQLHRSVNAPVSLAITVLGIAAMLLFAVLQSLLVVGVVRFEQTIATIIGLGGVIGLFVLVNGLLARIGHTLPSGMIWFMIAYGISTLLAVVGYWLGGQDHPLAAIGYLSGAIAGPIWTIWFGRLLLAEKVPAALAGAT